MSTKAARLRGVRLGLALLVVVAASAAAGLSGLVDFAPWRRAPHVLVLSGNIEAHESVLSFKTVQSRIVELPFDEGKWVDAETILARVEDADYRQQVATAEAALQVQERQLAASRENLDAARKTVERDVADVQQKTLDFERADRLWRQGIAATEDHDLAQTALAQSRAGLARDQALERAGEGNLAVAEASVRYVRETLEAAKIVLGYTLLSAPFAGVLMVRQAELGEVVLPGTPVFTLADLDHVWLRAYVNEPDLPKIRWGQAVTLRTDAYPDKRYQGRISFISSQAEFTPKSVETHAERVTLVYRIKIDVDNPNHELKPGLPADAYIDLGAVSQLPRAGSPSPPDPLSQRMGEGECEQSPLALLGAGLGVRVPVCAGNAPNDLKQAHRPPTANG
jgi:HlyD family secretion protein